MVLTKTERSKLRATIFRHLDGIATGPTAFCLQQAGVLDYILKREHIQLKDFTKSFNVNEGYLNVALRILCSQGWLKQHIDNKSGEISFELTPMGKIAFAHADTYREAVEFIPHAIRMDEGILKGFSPQTFIALKQLIQNHKNNWQFPPAKNELEVSVQQQILKHIEGLIAAPFIVTLGINGLFHKYFSLAPFKPEEFSVHPGQLREVVEFFTHMKWFSRKEDIYNFTPKGMFFARRASAYGVTVSYLPTFMRLRELIFGNPNVLWEKPAHSPEIHVNRNMNVWGSGGAHSTYFKKIDEIIIYLFNKPIDPQPKGIADMGSGNGAFLEHIFEVIWEKTYRGKMLDEFPLFIVASDYNEAALKATRKTLTQANVWAKVVWGDIGRPDLLAKELQEKYDIKLGDLLNVRSFLDHNRVYENPQHTDRDWQSSSSGAFSYRGQRLPNSEVEQSLAEHLKKWSPYVQRFGLLVLELHTLSPEIAAKNLGRTAVTAYDATHGYSDQYILELDPFFKAAKEAGLHPARTYQAKYPDSELATVSINLLRANR